MKLPPTKIGPVHRTVGNLLNPKVLGERSPSMNSTTGIVPAFKCWFVCTKVNSQWICMRKCYFDRPDFYEEIQDWPPIPGPDPGGGKLWHSLGEMRIQAGSKSQPPARSHPWTGHRTLSRVARKPNRLDSSICLEAQVEE